MFHIRVRRFQKQCQMWGKITPAAESAHVLFIRLRAKVHSHARKESKVKEGQVGVKKSISEPKITSGLHPYLKMCVLLHQISEQVGNGRSGKPFSLLRNAGHTLSSMS